MTSSASHTLTFSRLRANFTVDKELIGKQDPYIVFQSGSAKVQTKAIKGVGTGTAEWKESYTLEKFSPSSSSSIEVTVYNHNTLLPDSVIGSGTVDLSRQTGDSLSGNGGPISVVLTDKKGQEVGTLQFVTNGGGYTGRGGATGTGTGAGYGSTTGAGVGGVAAGAAGAHGTHGTHGVGSGTHGTHGVGSGTHSGVGSGTHSGVGSGTHSGVGSGTHSGVGSGTGGTVVGRGTGTDQHTAQKASDAAARAGHDVTIEGKNAVGVGHAVGSGTHGHHTGTGVGSGTHGHHTGTGVGSGVGTGAGYGSSTGTGTGQRSTAGEKVAGFIPGTEENKDKKAGYAPGQGPEHTHGNVTAGEKAASFIPGTQENRDKKAGTGAGYGTTGATGVTGSSVTGAAGAAYGTREGEVIDKKYYVGTEQRPQDQALIEQYREHNPYAKDYETTVQHTGRERLVGSQIEALGTRERVIGQDHKVQAHPQQEIARNLPAGALNERPGGEGWVQTKPGPICDTNTFSITGDRIVDKERVTDLREHREFEKEFEVKTRLVGERALDRGTDAEILNRERVLVDEKNKNACEGHPEAGNVSGTTLASQGVGSGVGTHTHGHHTGTGVGTGTHGHHTGTGVGSGYGSGTGTGAGYGSGVGSGTGQRSTLGEKAAGFIPGTEENKDKKQGYAPGQGPTDHTHGNVSAGEKAASFIPGTQENRDKKTAQYN